jgi:glutamyl-tRNA synthetase
MPDPQNLVITRFPPSPTGLFHVGSARTALFNYLFAKKYGGKMLLRLEDTDKERSKDEYAQNIFEGLAWLGITHDGEVLSQSKRSSVYRRYLEQMIAMGSAYVSEEEGGEGRRASVIRLRNKRTPITFRDELRGDITVDPSDLGDFIIAKDLDTPLYHLAVVVDDFETGVTHIIRGEDGIANTPRQIMIQEAVAAPRPIYIHIPFILGTDKTKLSKRHGATAVTGYRDEGYLPEAMINFLALLGWNPGTDEEFFSMEDLIKEFSVAKLQKSAAVFNIAKLNWFNAEYIKKMSQEKFLAYMEPLSNLLRKRHGALSPAFEHYLTSTLQHTTVKLSDILLLAKGGELDYLFSLTEISREGLLAKETLNARETSVHLEHQILLSHSDWTDTAIKVLVMPYADEKGRKNVLWPMRYALSGRDKSPDPFFLAYILGKDETIKRLKKAKVFLV